MPEFEFDVTDRALEYMAAMIDPMPGNEGQRVLTERLAEDADASAIVTVNIEGSSFNVDVEYDIDLKSNHPDAIEEIMKAAEQYFAEYAERAGEVEGLVDIAFGNL